MGGIASDITDKKNMEVQLELKNYALDNSPSAIGLADFNGVVFYVNNAFVKIWGYDNKTELIGKHMSEFSSSGNPSKEAFKTIIEGNVFIGEDKSVRKDGSAFNYIVSASMILHEQKPLCLMAVFVDNTTQKQLELNLKTNEEKLFKLNTDKDKFFSIIAHDLRSPFNGMLGLLEILANDYHEYSDEERLSFVQSSHTSAAKAFNLLNDLLEWARLQNEHFEIKKESLNLKEIITDNVEIYKKNASEKEIIIRININPSINITVDRNSIYSVVRNLLINAIKFTPNGGIIEFDLRLIQNHIELIIKDTGVGMSEETINKLFRLDQNITTPGTNNEQGTGLGLAICNDLVTKNNWKMNIESQLGKGTTFKLLIPK
jgi:PAS domain S-box-containing protein